MMDQDLLEVAEDIFSVLDEDTGTPTAPSGGLFLSVSGRGAMVDPSHPGAAFFDDAYQRGEARLPDGTYDTHLQEM